MEVQGPDLYEALLLPDEATGWTTSRLVCGTAGRALALHAARDGKCQFSHRRDAATTTPRNRRIWRRCGGDVRRRGV